MEKILVSLLLLSILLVPAMAFTQPNVTINSLGQLINAIKKTIWVISGLVALIAFVVAGILFLIAAGNPKKIVQAKTAFLWGIVGVAMGIVAYSIAAMVEIVLF